MGFYHLAVTSSEFSSHEKICIEKQTGLKGFSIQRPFQDATRTDNGFLMADFLQ